MNNINKLIYQCFRWHLKYGVIPIDIEGKLLRRGIRAISITRLIDQGYTPRGLKRNKVRSQLR